MESYEAKTAKQIIPATRILQSVVGTGAIKTDHIENAQSVINKVQGCLDLAEFSKTHLSEMSSALSDIKNNSGEDANIIERMTHSIVNFKSAAGTFDSGAYVTLCSMIFQFLESVKKVDDDFYDLMGVYFAVMTKILVDNAFTDDEIMLVTQEIKQTCDRYYARHPDVVPSKIIDNVDLSFDMEQSDKIND